MNQSELLNIAKNAVLSDWWEKNIAPDTDCLARLYGYGRRDDKIRPEARRRHRLLREDAQGDAGRPHHPGIPLRGLRADG